MFITLIIDILMIYHDDSEKSMLVATRRMITEHNNDLQQNYDSTLSNATSGEYISLIFLSYLFLFMFLIFPSLSYVSFHHS